MKYRATNFRRKLKPYIMLMPVMIFIIGIFITGLVFGLLQSLGYFPALGLYEISLDYYKNIFRNTDFLSSFQFSLYTSFISTLLSVVLGVFLSYLIIYTKSKHIKGLVNVYKGPILVPHTIAALLIFILFIQSGLLARIFYGLGLIHDMSDFPPLIFDGGGIGIILAYLWKGLPFITFITIDILRNLDDKYAKVAANLGASHIQVFRHVLLPQLFPTIASGFMILFAFSFGAYEIPHLLGASTPKALPVLAYIYYANIELANRANAMVINMCIAFFAFIALGLYVLAFRLLKKYGGA
jgi:putative spermidine/putrescine transport system permease protein